MIRHEAGGRRDAWKRREGTYTERQIQAPIAYHGTQTLFVLWLITPQLLVNMHNNNMSPCTALITDET